MYLDTSVPTQAYPAKSHGWNWDEVNWELELYTGAPPDPPYGWHWAEIQLLLLYLGSGHPLVCLTWYAFMSLTSLQPSSCSLNCPRINVFPRIALQSLYSFVSHTCVYVCAYSLDRLCVQYTCSNCTHCNVFEHRQTSNRQGGRVHIYVGGRLD